MKFTFVLKEDYYDSFGNESKNKLNSNPNLKSLVAQDKVNFSLVQIADQDKDANALIKMASLTNDFKSLSLIYKKLLQSISTDIFGNGKIPNVLDKKGIDLLIESLISSNINKTLAGHSSFLEFAKRIVNNDNI